MVDRVIKKEEFLNIIILSHFFFLLHVSLTLCQVGTLLCELPKVQAVVALKHKYR